MSFNFEGKRLWSAHRNVIGKYENGQFKDAAGTSLQRIESDRITDMAGTLMFWIRPGMEAGVTELTDPQGTVVKRIDSSGRVWDAYGNVEGFIE